MAIRKSDDIANERGDEYAKSKSTIKVEQLELIRQKLEQHQLKDLE